MVAERWSVALAPWLIVARLPVATMWSLDLLLLHSDNVYYYDRFTTIQLGTNYVDLYLIHHPRLAKPDIPTAWKQMEEIYEKGLAK